MAYEGISSYLHNRIQKALQKAFVPMENRVNLEKKIHFFHLEDCMVMHGIYHSDTLKKLITTVQKMHSKTTWNEKLFACKLNHGYHCYLSKDGVGHYTINSLCI